MSKASSLRPASCLAGRPSREDVEKSRTRTLGFAAVTSSAAHSRGRAANDVGQRRPGSAVPKIAQKQLSPQTITPGLLRRPAIPLIAQAWICTSFSAF